VTDVAKSTTDRILDVIDAGLQSSYETGCPAGSTAEDDSTWCVRCAQNERAEGIEMCEGCRAFLLGDSETDLGAARGQVEMVDQFGRHVGTLDAGEGDWLQHQLDTRREEFVAGAEALGVTREAALRLLSEELNATQGAEGVIEQAMARAYLVAAGCDPGPPGRAGEQWRRRYDPNTVPAPRDRCEYWRRRAFAATAACEPLAVTPAERHEIRTLDWGTSIYPYELYPYELRHDGEHLFGVALEVHRPQDSWDEWHEAVRSLPPVRVGRGGVNFPVGEDESVCACPRVALSAADALRDLMVYGNAFVPGRVAADSLSTEIERREREHN
jgi:hypothetical protein